ncbi:MAG: PA2779 family protein [Ignavibacteriales bacterium]
MTIIRKRIYKLSTITLILASFIPVFLISKSAECAMADSQMIFPSGKAYLREIDTEKVRRMLENKIVAERLRTHGLSKEEVIAKMAKMGDGQIHQLASLSDRLPAGGVDEFVFATTLIVLSLIIVGLIITVVVLA